MSNEDPFDNGKYKGVDPYYQTDPQMLDADPKDGVEGQSAAEVSGQDEKKSEPETAANAKGDEKADGQTGTDGKGDEKADGQTAAPKSATVLTIPAAPKK